MGTFKRSLRVIGASIMFSKTSMLIKIINVIRMLFDLIALWLYQIAMALLVGLMLLTTVDVIGRFFGHAVLGSYQISELVQVWILCLAWPLSVRLKAHVRVEFIASRFPKTLKKVIEYISDILILFVFALLGWQGIKNTLLSRELGDFVSIVEIPLYPFKLAIPIGALIACPVLLFSIIRALSKKRSERNGEL